MRAGCPDNDLVFLSPRRDQVAPGAVLAWLTEWVCTIGLPRIRLHDPRHGWATLALQEGIHPKVVMERHANIAITLDTYSHVTAGLHEEASEDVAAMFLPVSNPLAEGQ